ncbi:Gfo/Idh/MocA family protein [Cohnella yongneupensis]|uniref:Gfo/Idh/MocA family protein n=1 Tax=Cohnella yongneupensis TaxID=425006 RepID=A0ABW0QX55_9BACL
MHNIDLQHETKPLRIGIIGIGFWSMFTHVPAIRSSERAQLVSISRRTPERLELARQSLNVSHAYTDWRELINRNELDAVVVSTAHPAHAEPVIAALEHGLHVFVEKPLAVTSHDARLMVQAAEKAERVLMVGYDRRFKGLFRTIKSEIQNGAIGTVRQVSVSVAQDYFGLFGGDTIP